MVRNQFGGNKAKSFARKNLSNNNNKNYNIIFPSHPLEHFAIVSKILGNGMCYVHNNTLDNIICHIRKKLKHFIIIF